MSIAEPTVSTPVASEEANDRRDRLRQVLRSATFLTGLAVVLFWVFCAIFGSVIVPYDPYADDLMNALMPPSAEHWFGTDQLGRDVFSRVIVGARDILTIAPLATLISTVVGTALGLVMGYFRGFIDEGISRIVDAVLALPTVIVALLALVALGPSSTTVVFVIGFTFAPIIARTVRASVLAERELDYVFAAQLRRENAFHIMFVEILPNVLPPILVEATVRLGYAIFAVASLSFIGFGIQPPSPDWGLSISANYGLIGAGYWWTVLFDGSAIATLVVAVNLMADGIQGALDE
jgi:peptide/nickel transport system permease protein